MVEQWPIPQPGPGFLASLISELQWMDLQAQSLHGTLHRLEIVLEGICALLDRLTDEISKLAVRHSHLFSCINLLCSFRLF